MSGKIQHDPEAFMLALASAHAGRRLHVLSPNDEERWRRVARCAVEHLARDAAASAAAGASEVAQGAAMKVLERMLDILTPDQMPKLAAIMADLRKVPS